MPYFRFVLMVLTASLLVPEARAESVGKYYENTRWGYKLRVPAGWKLAAQDAGETTIASRHIGKRGLRPKRMLWAESHPELTVLGYPRREGATDVLAAYRARFQKPGAGTMRVLQQKDGRLELRIEGPASPPLRAVLWILKFDDIDFAVEARVLEDHFKSYEKVFRTCLKSFKRIDRLAALPGQEAAGSDATQREIDALPEGWTHHKSKHYDLLSNADKKFTLRTAKHADAMRAYLDKTLGAAPEGRAIIRVFASQGGKQAYLRRAAGGLLASSFFGGEILVAAGEDYSSLNMALLERWLDVRLPGLSDSLPDWLRTGLSQHLRFMVTKGGRARFRPDAWNKGQLRDAIKGGAMMPLRQLMLENTGRPARAVQQQASAPGYGLTFDNFTLQAGSVVSWLLTKGNRGKQKDLLGSYVGRLLFAMEQLTELPKFTRKEGESTEELAVRYGAHRQAIAKRRDEIARKAFDLTFADWKPADWQRFDQAWRAFAK